MALALVPSELSLFRKDISSPEMSQKASTSEGAGRGFILAVTRAFRGYVQSTNRRFPALGIFLDTRGMMIQQTKRGEVVVFRPQTTITFLGVKEVLTTHLVLLLLTGRRRQTVAAAAGADWPARGS